MQIQKKLIHCWKEDPFGELNTDPDLLEQIVKDMVDNGGDLAPNMHWHLLEKSDEEQKTSSFADQDLTPRYLSSYAKQYQTSASMTDAWIGSLGRLTLEDAQIERYKDFYAQIDKQGFFEALLENREKYYWLNTDLTTVQEISILDAFFQKEEEVFFLEVGGGYGRLCEAVLNVFKGVHYVMLDAVPGSMMFAYLFLKKHLPNHKIGFYYAGDPFVPEQYDCYIMPTWHFEKNNNQTYHASINIGSMQEMSQYHVDYFLNLFDSITLPTGLVFLSNAHDYVFQGQWNYPAKWKRMFIGNTPYSWSMDHPTELFTPVSQTTFDAFLSCYSVGSYRYQLRLAQDLLAQNERLIGEKDALHKKLAETKAQADDQKRVMNEQLSQIQNEFENYKKAIENSLSWKMTKPLRKMLDRGK